MDFLGVKTEGNVQYIKKSFKRRVPKPLVMPPEEEVQDLTDGVNNNNNDNNDNKRAHETLHEDSATLQDAGSNDANNNNDTERSSENMGDNNGKEESPKKRRRIIVAYPAKHTRVSVLRDGKWDDGEVMDFDESSQHLILWDAYHEENWLNLSTLEWKNSSKSILEKRKEDAAKRKLVNCLVVGTRIEVWWAAEEEYFAGVVKKIHNHKKRPHYIHYEDGQTERTDLFFERFKVLDGRWGSLKVGSKISIWNAGSASFVEGILIKVDRDRTDDFPHLINFGKSQEWLNLVDHEFYRRDNPEINVKTESKETPSGHRKQPGKKRAVYQLDLNTGKVLASFDSISDAARKTGCDASCLGRACGGFIKSAGGFGWRYKGEDSEKVQQLYPNSNEVISTFDSAFDAMKATSIYDSSIKRCCNGTRRTAGGYSWRYVDDGRKPKVPAKKTVKVKKEPPKRKPRKKTQPKKTAKQCDGLWKFRGIIGHSGPFRASKSSSCPFKLRIDWLGNWKPSECYEPLDTFYEQYPQLVYEYSRDNGLLKDPEWKKYVPWKENDDDAGDDDSTKMQGVLQPKK